MILFVPAKIPVRVDSVYPVITMSHMDGYDAESALGRKNSDENENEHASRPPAWKVHLALIMTQVFFGGGSVVGKVGTKVRTSYKINPITAPPHFNVSERDLCLV